MNALAVAPVEKTGIKPVDDLREQLALIEERVLTSYTLADAIREGASVTGKLEGSWVSDQNSCGNGAAWIAAKARGYVK